MPDYCLSRTQTRRRHSVEVMIGDVAVGADNPIRIQSMTTSNTQDVAATVNQTVALVEAGCEIVRVTAPNIAAARSLREIRRELHRRKIYVPLVADIHFLPAAAMEAVEHVEKIRVNPGNYADKKKFAVREYSDNQYDEELQRLHETFSPLVKRCQSLGRAMRIGTNHGSLSDRIMNRYGDTPLGMVESALEFLRIAEDNNFDQIVLSMKASNPKVMIQAYRLLVERMAQEDMHYPLHLGVTEAGDGEDGRIKSAIGIGSLLQDGLGDTIRVSLTEDSVYEIPVARAIADKAMSLWGKGDPKQSGEHPDTDGVNPFVYARRNVSTLHLGESVEVSPEQPPRVVAAAPGNLSNTEVLVETLQRASRQLKDTPAEGLILDVASSADLKSFTRIAPQLAGLVPSAILHLDRGIDLSDLESTAFPSAPRVILLRNFAANEADELERFVQIARAGNILAAVDAPANALTALAPILQSLGTANLIFTLSHAGNQNEGRHPLGDYRQLADALRAMAISAPIWIRNADTTAIQSEPSFLSRLLEASFLTGGLLCDGIGDLVSIESEPDFERSVKVAYNVLQGAGSRITKTEFVACPSCGRTLFDLQSTTQRIRERTGHLKGVKIAVMGCIVNGPGEMADADFGYVGGAPGKINLYVGKTCVKYNIPADEAVARLIDLIREHGKWTDPDLKVQPVPTR